MQIAEPQYFLKACISDPVYPDLLFAFLAHHRYFPDFLVYCCLQRNRKCTIIDQKDACAKNAVYMACTNKIEIKTVMNCG